MKTNTTKRILSETPQEVKDEIRNYGNKIVSMKNKTVGQLAEDVCNKEGLSWENEYAKESFILGFSRRKEIEQKIIADMSNKYKSWLSEEQTPKLDKTANYERLTSYRAYIEVLEEIKNKLK